MWPTVGLAIKVDLILITSGLAGAAAAHEMKHTRRQLRMPMQVSKCRRVIWMRPP